MQKKLEKIVELCMGHVHVHGKRALHCDTSLLPNSSVHFGSPIYVCHHFTRASLLTHTHEHAHQRQAFLCIALQRWIYCLYFFVRFPSISPYSDSSFVVVAIAFPSFNFFIEFIRPNFRLVRYENVICYFPVLSFVFRMQYVEVK